MPENNLKRRPLRSDNQDKDETVPGSPKSPQRKNRNKENVGTPKEKKVLTPNSNLYPRLSDNEMDSGSEEDEVDNACDKKPTPSARDKRKKETPVSPRKKQTQSDQKDTSKTESGFQYIIFLIIGIVSVVAGVCLYLCPSNSAQETETKIDYYKLYSDKFSDFQKKYPAQSSRFWKLVNAPVRRLLTAEQSDYPAVLLFGVPRNGGKAAECFTKKLIMGLNALYSIKLDSYIDASNLSSLSPDQAKLLLDEELKKVLSISKGVIIDHLEMLPAEGGLLLHGYCDGDNAPFKQSVIILVFHTDKTYEELNEKTFEDHLTKLWEPVLGADEMPALLSRIANNVAIIKPDKADC